MPASYGPSGKGKKPDVSADLLKSANELVQSFSDLSAACQDAAKSVSSLGSAASAAAINLAKISQLKQITLRDVEKSTKDSAAKVSERAKAEIPGTEEVRGLPSVSQLVENLNKRVADQAEEISRVMGERFLGTAIKSLQKGEETVAWTGSQSLRDLVSMVDPDRLTRDMLTMESGEDLANGISEIAAEIQSNILGDLEAAKDAKAAEDFISRMQRGSNTTATSTPRGANTVAPESEEDLISGVTEVAGELSRKINETFQEISNLKINEDIARYANSFEENMQQFVEEFDPISQALEAAAEHARMLDSVIDEDLIAGIDEIQSEIQNAINKGFVELQTIDRTSPQAAGPYVEEKAGPISTVESLASGAGFGGGNIGMLANLAGPIVSGIMKFGETVFKAASAFSDFAIEAVAALDPSLAFRLGIAVKDLYATFGIALKPLVESFVDAVRMIGDYLTPVVKRIAPIFDSLGETLVTFIEALMPWVSLLLEGISQAVGILNTYVIGPLADAFKYFTKMMFWTSDYAEKGSSAGAAAMKASYSGIAEYGKNIMQQALGSSSGLTANLKTAENTAKMVELLEEMRNGNRNEPWEREGAGQSASWRMSPTALAKAFEDESAGWM